MSECLNGFESIYNKIVSYEGEYDEKLDDYKVDIVIPTDWLALKTGMYKTFILGDNLFKDFHLIKSVIIPDIISEIGTSCFYACSSLKTVKIPPLVKEIKDFTFSNCTSLKSIELPECLETIGAEAFYGCSNLEKIVIGKNVRKINSTAFNGCSKLKCIILENKEREYSTDLNNSCLFNKNTMEIIQGNIDFIIPDYIKRIGFRAFYQFDSKNDLIIPNGVESIDNQAFSMSSFNKLEIPSSIKEINDNAFALAKCASITSKNARFVSIDDIYLVDKKESSLVHCAIKDNYDIPDGIKIIGLSNFSNMNCLSIIIPNGIEIISDSCFNNTTVNETIILPNTIKFISDNAFVNFNGVIVFNGTSEELSKISISPRLKEIIYIETSDFSVF